MKINNINLDNYRDFFPRADWETTGNSEYDAEFNTRFYPPDYEQLIESIGIQIIVSVSDDGWQGDTRLLFYEEDKYGFLVFGWGSCSGCDALQACQSKKEVLTVR